MLRALGSRLGRPPHPVIVTTRHNKDYVRVLLYSDYTTITGWGVLPRSRAIQVLEFLGLVS